MLVRLGLLPVVLCLGGCIDTIVRAIADPAALLRGAAMAAGRDVATSILSPSELNNLANIQRTISDLDRILADNPGAINERDVASLRDHYAEMAEDATEVVDVLEDATPARQRFAGPEDSLAKGADGGDLVDAATIRTTPLSDMPRLDRGEVRRLARQGVMGVGPSAGTRPGPLAATIDSPFAIDPPAVVAGPEGERATWRFRQARSSSLPEVDRLPYRIDVEQGRVRLFQGAALQ